MSDEPGVLGNLPRSRPGHRSDKRGVGVRAAAAATAADAAKVADRKPAAARAKPARRKPATTARPKAKATAQPKARPKPAAKPRARAGDKPATAPRAAAEPRRERPQLAAETAAPTPSDPLTGAVRLAGKVAEAGLKTAGSLLRRLPGR
jgi:histone H1/5